jgi:hypothetical protein
MHGLKDVVRKTNDLNTKSGYTSESHGVIGAKLPLTH